MYEKHVKEAALLADQDGLRWDEISPLEQHRYIGMAEGIDQATPIADPQAMRDTWWVWALAAVVLFFVCLHLLVQKAQ